MRLRAGAAMTTVLTATHVGLNLAPQVNTHEMLRPGTFLKQQIPGGRCLLDSVVGLAERSWCPLLCPWYHASQSVLCVSHHQARAPGRGIWRCCWQAGGPRGKPFVGIGACGQAQYPSSQVSSQVSTQSPLQRAGFHLCSLDVQCVCCEKGHSCLKPVGVLFPQCRQEMQRPPESALAVLVPSASCGVLHGAVNLGVFQEGESGFVRFP